MTSGIDIEQRKKDVAKVEAESRKNLSTHEYLLINTDDIDSLTYDLDGYAHITVGKKEKMGRFKAINTRLMWRGEKWRTYGKGAK
jgi:hypothetical protein